MAKHSLAWASLLSTAATAHASAVNLFLGDGKESRIIGGEKAPSDRFPYAVPLHIDGSHNCGGFLIAPNAVLTAAHCMDGERMSDVTVFIGSDDVDGGTEYNIADGYEHPDYDADTNEYDMYVIILDGEVNDITPVLLNADGAYPTSGMMSTVMGWGEDERGDSPEELHSVELEVLSNEECKDYDKDYFDWVYPDMICTLTPGKDSCYGDSGGPVVIEDPDSDPSKDVAFGIVSWGVGCAGPPGVYARVSAGIDWIVDRVCNDHDGSGPLCGTPAPTPEPTAAPTPGSTPNPTAPPGAPTNPPNRVLDTDSPTSSPTPPLEATDVGFDLSADPSFTPRLVGSVIGQHQTLHMRIFCPGPDTVAPGYEGVRINWNDLRRAQWELKLDGKDRIGKADLTSLGNGNYVAQMNLVDAPLGSYEVKLKIEDNDGNKLEYKEEQGSVIEVVEAFSSSPTGSPTKEPSASPTPLPTNEPTAMPSKAPTSAPTTAEPTPAITPNPTAAPSLRPTSSPSSPPSTSPTPPPVSSCSLPAEGPFLLVTTDGGCADSRELVVDPWQVNLSDTLTIVLRDDSVDINRIWKIESEFKVEGDKDRKTKFKIEVERTDGFDTFEDFFLRADPSLPYAVEEDGVVYVKLEIDVSDIGGIGGNANGDDNDPVQVGEEIEWKFKVSDWDGETAEYRDEPPIQVVAP